MISTGMNGYINAQGLPKLGMISVVIGAVLNIILDPIFIFVFDMGVAGAAFATVISQAFSASWIIAVLFSQKMPVKLSKENIRINKDLSKEISKLGTSNFIMSGTVCLVQIVCNSTLQNYGGDLYIGIMTVTNSIREIFHLPLSGLVGGVQPVISYNYGASSFDRVKKGIRINTVWGTLYALVTWVLILLFPKFWFNIFSNDATLLTNGVEMLKIYFFGFVFMALQIAGQSVFQALGDTKHAIFFSLLRKVFIIVPLTIILPIMGFGVKGVFLAEPISNVIGGIACYTTMRISVHKKLKN